MPSPGKTQELPEQEYKSGSIACVFDFFRHLKTAAKRVCTPCDPSQIPQSLPSHTPAAARGTLDGQRPVLAKCSPMRMVHRLDVRQHEAYRREELLHQLGREIPAPIS